MWTYERTHPWIKFELNFEAMGPEFWLNLGEALSKSDHLARMPLRPNTSDLLHRVYLAKGAAATTAIEGNTLSEEEVQKAVEGTLEVNSSKEYQKQEVENIINIFNEIGNLLPSGKLPPLSEGLICDYNAQILKGLPQKEEVIPGHFRTHSVLVGNVYRGAPAQDCLFLVKKLCDWLNGPDFESKPGLELVYAIIKAVVAHIYIAWIHPFGDGNGRTARLIEAHLLLSAGMPLPASHLLSNHYNETRAKYYQQLDRASKSGGDLLPFLRYSVEGLVDGLRGQLDFVWMQLWDMTWRNYIHELFKKKNSPSDRRQRDLALEIGNHKEWINVADISEFSIVLAKAYSNKTPKTLQRDLKHLIDMELLEKELHRVRARRELIFRFLPIQKKSSKN